MVPRKKRQRYYWQARSIGASLGVEVEAGDWETIWRLLDEHGEIIHVYAIVDSANGLVKIGKSVNPGERLKSLQTANGIKLRIWGFCPETAELSERSLHAELSEHRIGGEWFRLNAQTRMAIDRIRAAAGVSHQQF